MLRHFPIDEYETRWQRVERIMTDAGFDAAVVVGRDDEVAHVPGLGIATEHIVVVGGAGLRELMAIIEVLRGTAIHGSGEMKELAIALLQARAEAGSGKCARGCPR